MHYINIKCTNEKKKLILKNKKTYRMEKNMKYIKQKVHFIKYFKIIPKRK